LIKVTVFAGDGKFTEFKHELAAYKITDGVLHLYLRPGVNSGDSVISYAPGAWLKVERDVNEANST
jgi:hypothetical protein